MTKVRNNLGQSEELSRPNRGIIITKKVLFLPLFADFPKNRLFYFLVSLIIFKKQLSKLALFFDCTEKSSLSVKSPNFTPLMKLKVPTFPINSPIFSPKKVLTLPKKGPTFHIISPNLFSKKVPTFAQNKSQEVD